jgi:hypothetical protein
VVFSGNVVAGCPDIGVLMRPETCEAVEQDTHLLGRDMTRHVSSNGDVFVIFIYIYMYVIKYIYIYIIYSNDTTKNPHGYNMIQYEYNMIQYDTIMDV